MSIITRYLLQGFCGLIVWFIAAMFIRFALPLGWLEGNIVTIIIFIVSLPVAAISIELVHRFTDGQKGEKIRTAAVLSLVGLLLDGMAITWTPLLYTADRAALSFGGAWLLWTVGLTLTYALARDLQ
jgi:hypothetical protein